LEATSRGAGTRHLVDFYQIREAFNGHGADGLRGNVAFRQLQSVGRCEHGTRLCHLFHASGQMGRLTDDIVIHVQIVADCTDDNLP
jgi:hypothetical protein